MKDVHDIITGVKIVEVDSEKETNELILEAFLQYGHDFDKICDEVGKCNHSYVTKFLNSIKEEYDEKDEEEADVKDEETTKIRKLSDKDKDHVKQKTT